MEQFASFPSYTQLTHFTCASLGVDLSDISASVSAET